MTTFSPSQVNIRTAKSIACEISDSTLAWAQYLIDEATNNSHFETVLKLVAEKKVKKRVIAPPFGSHFANILQVASWMSKKDKMAIIFSFNGALHCVFPSFDFDNDVIGLDCKTGYTIYEKNDEKK